MRDQINTINTVRLMIINFLTGKRMKALYWTVGTQFISGAGDLIVSSLTTWNPDNMITVFAGLIIAQITKQLNSKK